MTKQQGAGMPDEIYLTDEFADEMDCPLSWVKERENERDVKYLRADLATADKPQLKTTTNYSCAPEIEEDQIRAVMREIKTMQRDAVIAPLDIRDASIRIIKAARAYASQSKADQWQDISTAPRDGTHILVFPALMGVPLVSSWEEKSKEFKFVGFWRNPMTEQPVPYKPTHWMPLPAPPKGAADAN